MENQVRATSLNRENSKQEWEHKMDKLWLDETPTFKQQKDLIREILDEENETRIVTVAKDGWPLETIANSPFTNFIRRLFLTKEKITYKEWLKRGGCKIKFGN